MYNVLILFKLTLNPKPCHALQCMIWLNDLQGPTHDMVGGPHRPHLFCGWDLLATHLVLCVIETD